MKGRAGVAATEATAVAAAQAAMIAIVGRSVMDATVTKDVKVATAAMAAIETIYFYQEKYALVHMQS